ncbi:unnamed protein product [Durusdinium trenchii]|uniref:OTU domain-containing protein n=2 Tax=Durusdinium trenchii TaxID=1381693 RepID=A0ABP0SDU8_9DINO
MGQCSTSQDVPEPVPLRGGDSFASTDLANRFEEADGGHVVLVPSRDVDLEAVKTQRAEAVTASNNVNRLSGMSRKTTRHALEEPPDVRTSFQRLSTSLRLSRMGTMKRNKMIHDVKAAESSQGLQGASLEKRLQTFGMQMVEMAGDGNCQFRTMAFNLFRSQEHHAAVRQSAVAHMRKHADFFGVFFEDEAEFGHYCKNMALHGTWGDELTLRAVVEAYGCIAHVITSEPTNWHLVYEPESSDMDSAIAVCPLGMDPPKARKQIFLAYISPIHYNAIIARKPQ